MLSTVTGDKRLDHTTLEFVDIAIFLWERFLDALILLLSPIIIVGVYEYRVIISNTDAKLAIPATACRGTRTVSSLSIGPLVLAARG